MNNYLKNLNALLEKYDSVTRLAADIGTCERTLKRWLNEEHVPIHRFKVKIRQLVDEWA